MDLKQALDPTHQVCVKASAGSGKTWLLVTRFIRLLIEGVPYNHIIALTFTRKACTEMQERVLQTLEQLSLNEQSDLVLKLEQYGINATEQNLQRATKLYEHLLRAQQGLRITTFHAFCQELLKRFPFEAKIPPNFELIDETESLVAECMDNIISICNQDPDSLLAEHLQTLFARCNSLYTTKALIKTFIDHRSDWWAFSQQQLDPLAFANQELMNQLKLETDPPLLRSDEFVALTREYLDLLARHNNNTTITWRENIELGLNATDERQALELIYNCFYTQKNTLRKISTAMEKSIGATDLPRFYRLYEDIPQLLLDYRNSINKLDYYQLCLSWYYVGHNSLLLYQKLKSERRLLDFADLEWHAYQLLNKSNYALWIQYKLDAKFDHMLIDEFQDTNPTQWQLIHPLVEEIASQPHDKSLFIVGDEKQSIYGFRRADAELFRNVQVFIQQRNGIILEQHKSRRSSPEIINFLNMVFQANADLLPAYQQHSSFNENVWGCVEVHAAFISEHNNEETIFFRNPLQQAKINRHKSAHELEADYIAEKIESILNQGLVIQDGDKQRTAIASDIMILLRKRTHIAHYQFALQKRNIAYVSNSKGTLFENQEILDTINLLSLLVAPHNNLALASVLKSPFFSCTDNDLITISNQTFEGSWWNKLQNLSTDEVNSSLQRAKNLIGQWMNKADHIPIHDLLDQILFQGDVRIRYEQSYPEHISYRIRSSIAKLLDLSLQINNGRYPSISRFLENIERLRSLDTPDEEIIAETSNRVQILTIHSAKGLEAPIVFLADTAATTQNHDTKAWINWPAGKPQPSHFLLENTLANSIKELDPLVTIKKQKQAIEDANLFYVAMSRARQALYISASLSKKVSEQSWYARLNNICPLDEETPLYRLQYNPATYKKVKPTNQNTGEPETITELFRPSSETQNTSPSSSNDDDKWQNNQAKQRGQAIHRMIQLINMGKDETELMSLVRREFLFEQTNLQELYLSSLNIVHDKSFDFLFDKALYQQAWNEVPITFNEGTYSISGVIDRLVATDNALYIVDYKSGEIPSEQDPLREKYRNQLNYYRKGLDNIWPTKNKHAFLIFTDKGKIEKLF